MPEKLYWNGIPIIEDENLVPGFNKFEFVNKKILREATMKKLTTITREELENRIGGKVSVERTLPDGTTHIVECPETIEIDRYPKTPQNCGHVVEIFVRGQCIFCGSRKII